MKRAKPKQPDLEGSIQVAVSGAIGVAEALIEAAGLFGPITKEVVLAAETKSLDLGLEQLRASCARRGVNGLAVLLLQKPVEEHFKAEFRRRFHKESVAAFAHTNVEGCA